MIASLGCAVAPSVFWLIVARALQGVGARPGGTRSHRGAGVRQPCWGTTAGDVLTGGSRFWLRTHANLVRHGDAALVPCSTTIDRPWTVM